MWPSKGIFLRDASFLLTVEVFLLGDSFCNPNPHIQGKNMDNNMAPKLPNLPCFEAFGVIFCPDVCSYFCLVCGGRGHQRTSDYLRFVFFTYGGGNRKQKRPNLIADGEEP